MSIPRLRILELPIEHQGECSNTPYLLIIDRCSPEMGDNLRTTDSEAIQASIGARGILAFDFEIDIE